MYRLDSHYCADKVCKFLSFLLSWEAIEENGIEVGARMCLYCALSCCAFACCCDVLRYVVLRYIVLSLLEAIEEDGMEVHEGKDGLFSPF